MAVFILSSVSKLELDTSYCISYSSRLWAIYETAICDIDGNRVPLKLCMVKKDHVEG